MGIEWKTSKLLLKYSVRSCKVYEVKLRTRENANFLESLVGREGFDFWSMTKLLDSTATVMVAPDHTLWFESALAQRNADFDITIDDLEAYKPIKTLTLPLTVCELK